MCVPSVSTVQEGRMSVLRSVNWASLVIHVDTVLIIVVLKDDITKKYIDIKYYSV